MMLCQSVSNSNKYRQQQQSDNLIASTQNRYSSYTSDDKKRREISDEKALQVHVIRSTNNIRFASLAAKKQTTTATHIKNRNKSDKRSQNKKSFGVNSSKLSLSSYYNRIMSSLMLDLGGKIQQLTNNLQKNHRRINESRLTLISDDCYKTCPTQSSKSFLPPTFATVAALTTTSTTASTTTATPVAETIDQNRLSTDDVRLSQQRQEYRDVKQRYLTTMINKSSSNNKCSNVENLLEVAEDESDNRDDDKITEKLLMSSHNIHNDCQPLLKIAPKYNLKHNRLSHHDTDMFQQQKLSSRKKSSKGCCLSRFKYSIESLEYQRHLDNVQHSFLTRNYLGHSINLCQTMLWMVAFHILALTSSSNLQVVQGAQVVEPHAIGHNQQLLIYAPVPSAGAPAADQSANGGQQSQLGGSQTSSSSATTNLSPDAGDYVDDGADMDIMVGQQQIPTAHLLSAAGHIVPDNYFGPNSIPLSHYSAASQQQSLNHHTHQSAISMMDPMQAASSERDVIVNNANQQHMGPGVVENLGPYIDYNGYNLATQPQQDSPLSQADVVEFNGQSPSNAAYYAIYNGENPMPHSLQISLPGSQHSEQDQQVVGTVSHYNQMMGDNQAFSQSLDGNEQNLPVVSNSHPSSNSGVYSNSNTAASSNTIYTSENNNNNNNHGGRHQQVSHQQASHQTSNNYGQPTRDGTSPKDLLSPSQAIPTNTISSPTINALATMPKVNMQQLASKIPQVSTPQFSFSSSKDPMDKVKVVNQKKRTMMRQAEQLAKLMLESFNKKFGTTIGDQTDIPFVLSTLGPLGFAQNLLFDPSFLITLLHSTEKGYISDVLPSPAKMIIRPVLNAFRMPNKKRGDKGNLVNVLSYISSGLQAPSGLQPNHRQAGTKKGVTKKY